MLTRRIDAALDALAECRLRVPGLRDVFRPDAPERAALDDVLAAMERFRAVAQGGGRSPGIGAVPEN